MSQVYVCFEGIFFLTDLLEKSTKEHILPNQEMREISARTDGDSKVYVTVQLKLK